MALPLPRGVTLPPGYRVDVGFAETDVESTNVDRSADPGIKISGAPFLIKGSLTASPPKSRGYLNVIFCSFFSLFLDDHPLCARLNQAVSRSAGDSLYRHIFAERLFQKRQCLCSTDPFFRVFHSLP